METRTAEGCIDIPASCNFTQRWTDGTYQTCLLVPTLITVVITLLGGGYKLIRCREDLKKAWRANRCSKMSLIMLFVGLVTACGGVYTDLEYFKGIETGTMLAHNIAPDIDVANAILVFACFGVVKCAIVISLLDAYIRVIHLDAEREDGGGGEMSEPVLSDWRTCGQDIYGDGAEWGLTKGLLGFIIVDGVELLLQYFWVDKYKPLETETVILKCSFVLITSFLVTCNTLKNSISTLGRYFAEEKWVEWLGIGALISLPLSNTFACLLRACSALMIMGKEDISPGCLYTEDNRLVRSPFNSQCLDVLDKTILALTCAPAVLCFLYWLFYTVYYCVTHRGESDRNGRVRVQLDEIDPEGSENNEDVNMV